MIKNRDRGRSLQIANTESNWYAHPLFPSPHMTLSKRLSSMGLTATLLMNTFVPTSMAASPTKTEESEAMEFTIERGLLWQMDDTEYHPEAVMTRMEFLQMVLMDVYTAPSDYQECFVNIAPDQEVPYTHLFGDVSREAPFARELCMGMFVGLASGYKDATFRPNQQISNAEAIKMITKAYGLVPFMGLRQDPRVPWYEPYRYALAKNGDLKMPMTAMRSPLTRNQAALMFYRLRNLRPAQGVHYESQKAMPMMHAPVKIEWPAETTDTTIDSDIDAVSAPAATTTPEDGMRITNTIRTQSCTRPSRRSILNALENDLPPPSMTCSPRFGSDTKEWTPDEGLANSRAYQLGRNQAMLAH